MIHPHDTATFTQIYNEYFEQVYAYAREAGGADAFDIVHDAFLYLYKHDHVFESKEKVRNYLIKMVRSRCINRNNTANRLVEATEDLHDIEDERAELEGLFMEKIIKMFNKLPKETKKVIELRYFKGLETKEIARTLGISESTVRSQYDYGVKRMRLWDGSYEIPKRIAQRNEALKTVREIVARIGAKEFTKITGDKTFTESLRGDKLSNLSTKRILENIERYYLITSREITNK